MPVTSTTQTQDMVLIVGDHHRADFLGSAGNVLVHTPNLDALAASGASFERAVTVYPAAAPAMTALLSGAYPDASASASDTATLANSPLGISLKAAGYSLCQIDPTDSLAATTSAAADLLAQPGTGPRAVLIQLPPIWSFEDIEQTCFTPYRGNGVPMASYFAAVTAYDDAIGKMLTALDRSGRRDSTVVVYTSLSGEQYKYRDFVNHANTCHDDSIRVPLLISAPGMIAAGKTSDALVGSHDISPTLAALAGTTISGAQGRDLLPLLMDDTAASDWRKLIYLHNTFLRHIDVMFEDGMADFAIFPDWEQRAIWDGRHKLILSADGGECRLYDLLIDPEEEFNLFGLPNPSPQGLTDQFASRRDQIEVMAATLRDTATELGDALGVRLADLVIAQPAYGTRPQGDRI
ncbi:sulfatase-like hydrolase/transferase [Marinovum sp. 2_MG-2023]|uniref:sulfatase family protein n=1 Tax=unclassified Marinovum TaxID=2647166 RepID=UPI0026E2208D|nr:MULTISPECIES: sulfatase-like hydrolase/transferase [unclassified Marinovum]MDO6732277.1 sulfatase-like hydrolase/transferase [Marinovum sp. 2_MG-2023]